MTPRKTSKPTAHNADLAAHDATAAAPPTDALLREAQAVLQGELQKIRRSPESRLLAQLQASAACLAPLTLAGLLGREAVESALLQEGLRRDFPSRKVRAAIAEGFEEGLAQEPAEDREPPEEGPPPPAATSPLTLALQIAATGCRVFPISTSGTLILSKPESLQRASADPGDIGKLWAGRANSGVGVVDATAPKEWRPATEEDAGPMVADPPAPERSGEKPPPRRPAAPRVDVADVRTRAADDWVSAYYAAGFPNDPGLKRSGHDAKGLCCFHPDTNPSFTLTVDGEAAGLWYCFGCSRGGDLFDFVQEFHHCEFPEALDRLAGLLGVQATGQPRAKRPTKITKAAKTLPALPSQLVEGLQRNLAKHPERMEFLRRERCLSEDMIRKAGLGYHPTEERLTIPVYSADGALLDIRKFLPHCPEDGTKVYPWQAGRGSARLYFPPQWEAPVPGGRLLIAEGELDALLLVDLGERALTNTNGASYWPAGFELDLAGVTVYAVGDNDQPGQDRNAVVAAWALAHGAEEVRAVRWPEGSPKGFDVIDFLRENGAADDRQAAAQALEDLLADAPFVPKAEGETAPEASGGKGEEEIAEPPTIRVLTAHMDFGSPDAAVPESGWLRDYVDYCAETSEAPTAYNLAGGLAVLATTVGRKVWMQWGPERLYPNLYLAIIGAQARPRKSTAVRAAAGILADCFPASRDEDTNRVRLGALVPFDGSYEGILDALRENPVGLMTPRELSGLLATAARHYNAGLSQVLADVYDAPDEYVRRLRRETIIVERPAPNILGASTLSWLTEQTDQNALEGGLLSRFLFFFATRAGELKSVRPKHNENRRSTLKIILMQRLRASLARDGDSREMTWEPDAFAEYDRFYHAIEGRPADPEGPLAGFLSRLTVSSIKCAMLYQLAKDPESTTIGLDSWRLSEALMGYLRRGATEFVMRAGGDHWAKQRARVFELIPPPPGIKHRDVLHLSKLDKGEFQRAIDTLVGAGLVEAHDYKPARGPGGVCYHRAETAQTAP